MHDRLEGKLGRVTDEIPVGGIRRGEVMIEGQAYYATAVDSDTALAKGTRIVVVEHFPPRTVVVTPM